MISIICWPSSWGRNGAKNVEWCGEDIGDRLILQCIFFDLCIYSFTLDIGADQQKKAHINIGDPDQGEPGNKIASPVREQKMKSGDDQEQCGDIKAKTIFAGKQVEEFTPQEGSGALALSFAIFPGFKKDLFVGHRPGDTGDGNGKDKEPGKLCGNWGHVVKVCNFLARDGVGVFCFG